MNILVVDDSKTCRALYRKELVSGGYEVVEATDGVQALQVIQKQPIDLVVLDIEMPNMDGYETCEHLRNREFMARFGNRDTVLPVVFVTSNEAVEWRVKGFSKGANEFITKGFKPGLLLTTVNGLLKPQSPLAGHRALVVEERRFLRNMVAQFLTDHQVQVTCVESCEAAFDQLLRGDVPDMIITSLEMAGMTGDQLCRKVRADLGLKTLPILVLTESEKRNDLLDLFDAGATDYLVKPFERDELVSRLKVALQMVRTLKQEVENQFWQECSGNRDTQTALRQAEMATSVLHNIGNVLNSLFASCYQISHLLKDSRLRQLTMAHKLLEEHADNLGTFMTQDPRGKILPEYLIKSGKRLEEEHLCMEREVEDISTKINLMKDIIETQQLHAKTVETELMTLDDLLEEALKVSNELIRRENVELIRRSVPTRPVKVKRAPLAHVLINLIKNAVEAMRGCPCRRLEVALEARPGQTVVSVTDSGVGIDPKHLPQLFTHGFTTKADGHGFGLAYCAKAVADMHGELDVHSDGIGRGATFTISFPTP